MDIDIQEQKGKVEQDLANLKNQLQRLDQQRAGVVQQVVMRRGILQYLNSLDGHKQAEENKPKEAGK